MLFSFSQGITDMSWVTALSISAYKFFCAFVGINVCNCTLLHVCVLSVLSQLASSRGNWHAKAYSLWYWSRPDAETL